MALSTCYNLWVVQQDTKGRRRWINKGPAPEGACPDCPTAQFPPAGTWDGYSARCFNGAIVKMVSNGFGWLVPGETIQPVGSPKAVQACAGNVYISPGSISDYLD